MKTAIILAVCGAAGAASAQTNIMSFTYSDLNGSYASTGATTGQMDAVAVSSGALQTAGDVTRLVGAGGSALFESGFKGGSAADAQLHFLITAIDNVAKTAIGTGTFTLTDADGDTISGDINGAFAAQGTSFIFFNGTLDNIVMSAGTFDGSLSGSVDTTFAAQQPYSGALVQLTFGMGNFFASNFSNRSTLASGLIVPTPGAAALLGLGGLTAMRRRR